ncbi:sigma-70 family RNA polymerase sigma factor [Crassaminicella thermophila]|uniref:Sigma-70 family RNA polymerase sigma factor n=1 Tax=Crassaminicella thermophila TaxID=2599308 RepID=A0A5C0SC81_CRATE|nr:sigma-70 family RNA polymerase sigma factor [Crassaminicella thermophila]QEK11547.1 sigma-70 family RNA polymerase sigma factor [Crassaminicella thermophila]
MISDNKRSIILKNLQTLAKNKGYLTFDNILDISEKFDIKIDDVDRISESVLDSGIIIKDTDDEKEDKSNIDRSRIDYNEIYDKVLELDSTLKSYIKFIKKVPSPAVRELQHLIYQAKDGNKYAVSRIVYMYSKMVIKIALSFSEKLHLPIADTIQDGIVGLIYAIDKYDPSSEGGFATYAPWWIRQYIQREAKIINSLIYYPVYMKEKIFSIYDIVLEHICDKCLENGYCPRLLSQIQGKLECDLEQVVWFLNQLQEYYSIESLIGDNNEVFNDNNLFEDIMIENINRDILKDRISCTLLQFKERERKVIEKRFGFKNDIEMTLEEVGKEFGVTRERIRQIEYKVLKRLKHLSRRKRLK